MKTEVIISDAILQWVLQNVQLEKLPPDVADNLMKWATNEKKPTFNQIEKVSNASGIPLGYFFLQTPPQEITPLMEYRTVNSLLAEKPSRNLLDTIHDMKMIQSWTQDCLIIEGNNPLKCVGCLSHNEDYIQCAEKVREILDIPIDWYIKRKSVDDSFRFIRTAISNSGVFVMMNGVVGNNNFRVLDIEEFRAFVLMDKFAPLIFINANDSVNGRLFSLLHEFAHVCIGKSDFFNDRQRHVNHVNPIETLCNAIAAEILVPQKQFLTLWNQEIQKSTKEETIINLSRIFKCGTIVIARKALDNNFIDNGLYNKITLIAIKMHKEKKKSDNGGNFYRTAASRIDQRFFHMLTRSVSEGRTLYSDAFRLTNTNRSTFIKLVQAQNGGV